MSLNIDRFAKDLAALGVALPPHLAEVQAIDLALGILRTAAPSGDFEEDVKAGRITAANVTERARAAAIEMVTHAKARELANAAHDALNARKNQALAADGDAIIAAMVPAFELAAKDLAAFVERFGADPAAEAVLAAEGGSEAWQARSAALATFDRVRRVAFDLFGPYFGTEAPTWFIASAADTEALRLARNVYSHTAVGFIALIAAGFTLKLNTAVEAEGVVDAVKADAKAKAAAAAAERAAEKERLRAERERWDAERRQALARTQKVSK